MLDDGPAERLAMARHDQRLVDAAAHHGGGPDPMRQPRQVDLVHHLLESLIEPSDRVGESALKMDLTRGH